LSGFFLPFGAGMGRLGQLTEEVDYGVVKLGPRIRVHAVDMELDEAPDSALASSWMGFEIESWKRLAGTV